MYDISVIPILITALIGCFVCVYIKWQYVKKYWSIRGVPHPPPSPLFGSLTFLQKENAFAEQASGLAGDPSCTIAINSSLTTCQAKNPSQTPTELAAGGKWFIRIKEQFKSPYIGIWIFWRPGIIINSPEIAHNILVRDFDNFRNRFASSGKSDPIGGLNIFMANDPLWTNIRRQITVVFTAAKLRNLQDYMRSKAKELVQRIDNDKNTNINLRNMYIDYTTDIIGASAFGVKSDATLTGEGPLRNVTREFSKYSIYRGLCFISIFYLPKLVDIFRFKYFPTSSSDYFKRIFHTVASEREASPKESENKDLLGTLLKIKKENKLYSDDLIIAQAAIFLLGGFDTSATMLTFLTYELAYHPDIQEKLYKELKHAREKNGNGDFDVQILTDLTFLDCVIKEGLRKYPIMGWLDRVAANDYEVDDKLTIEAGTVVYVNGIGMHYDPEYYPNPHEFNPDRFLPENKEKLNPYTFLPFGEGPRFCIGMRYGMMTIQFALSSILLRYEIRPLPNEAAPKDILIDKIGIFYLPGQPMHVDFVPRK